MAIRTAKRLESFPEYIHSRMAREAADIEKKTGRKVLSFGAGSPDFPPSQKYVDRYADLVRLHDAHLYPGYGGIPKFQTALQTWYEKRFGVKLASDEILPLIGGRDGTSHLPFALLDPQDELLVPDPGYPGFVGTLPMVGATPVFYELPESKDFRLDIAKIEEKVTSKTRGLWANFPSNPTGQVATKEELALLVAFAKKRNLFILYDNAYSEVTFDGFKAPSILEVSGATEVAVELGSFSKMRSFAGYRMGWVAGNRDAIAALAKVKSQIDSGLSLSLQRLGAFALLEEDSKWERDMLQSYEARRNTIGKFLRTLGMSFTLPKGALYLWAKIPESAKDSESFAMDILRDKQILVTPGTAFGESGSRYVRASFCVNIDGIEEYFPK